MAAAEAAFELPPPTAEEEQWRYGPINDFEIESYEPSVASPGPIQVPTEGPSGAAALEAASAVVTVADGWVVNIEVSADAAALGLTIQAGLNEPRTGFGEDADRFDRLHEAFAPPTLCISMRDGAELETPVVIRSHHTGQGRACFPHAVVETGEDAGLDVVEYQTSTSGKGFAAPVVQLSAGAASRLRYVVVQELGEGIVQLGRILCNVGSQATATAAMAAFGGSYARVRTDTRLVGRGATGNLIAIYYADQNQVHDFRTYQHHDAPDTQSDLMFKGAADDNAGSIYTGLIHIHPDGRGSNAHQTNRNIKLSDAAWAWSVPNLEIENNEVRCSHASTVSPIDLDQQFYLHSRGVPPAVADRLIVSGFFGEVVDRFPGVGIQDEIRRLVAEKLDRRGANQ